jgi:hypothetical protein
MVESNKVLLEKVDTLENIANSLTKSVSVVKFSWCRDMVPSYKYIGIDIHHKLSWKYNVEKRINYNIPTIIPN